MSGCTRRTNILYRDMGDRTEVLERDQDLDVMESREALDAGCWMSIARVRDGGEM